MKQLTHLTVVERSRKGTGFDYWLGITRNTDGLPFQKIARLAVSGIRQGNLSQVRARVKLKLEQIASSNSRTTAYIVIVEFSQPSACIIRK
jgi:hypothetical protein